MKMVRIRNRLALENIILGDNIAKNVYSVDSYRGLCTETKVCVKIYYDIEPEKVKAEFDINSLLYNTDKEHFAKPYELIFFHVSDNHFPDVNIMCAAYFMEQLNTFTSFSKNPEDLKKLLSDVCIGISVMHKAGFLHNDIKPSNIGIKENSGTYVLFDFGISVKSSDTFYGGVTNGTAYWIAPEILKNNIYSTRGDFYSLGLTLREIINGKEYECDILNKRLLYEEKKKLKPLITENPSLKLLYKIINKLSAFDKNNRYAGDGIELMNDLNLLMCKTADIVTDSHIDDDTLIYVADNMQDNTYKADALNLQNRFFSCIETKKITKNKLSINLTVILLSCSARTKPYYEPLTDKLREIIERLKENSGETDYLAILSFSDAVVPVLYPTKLMSVVTEKLKFGASHKNSNISSAIKCSMEWINNFSAKHTNNNVHTKLIFIGNGKPTAPLNSSPELLKLFINSHSHYVELLSRFCETANHYAIGVCLGKKNINNFYKLHINTVEVAENFTDFPAALYKALC